MSIPAIILIVIYSIDTLYAAHMHGEDAPKINFWTSIFAKGLILGLLLWGGFFN